MRDLLEAAMELIGGIWQPPSPVRLISVTALALTDRLETYEQLDLLAPQRTEENAKLERLESAVDAIRKKYGSQAISFGETAGKEIDAEE